MLEIMQDCNQYWLDRWGCGDVKNFCQDAPNEYLVKHFPKFKQKANSVCFMPMCGNSIDIMFFLDHQIKVIGVELSEKAVKSFFIRNGIEYCVIKRDDYTLYQGNQVSIYVADIFLLPTLMKEIDSFDIWYDRGAYVALPDHLRSKYADMMVTTCSKETQILLLTMTHDRTTLTPPFSISEEEITDRFSHLDFKLIDSQLRESIPDYRKAEGMTYQYYNVYIRN